MPDYSRPGADNRFAMERAQQLDPLLRGIPWYAGLDIVPAGLRVSHSHQRDQFETALAHASPRHSTPPIVFRPVQFSMKHLLPVLTVVRNRRGHLAACGAHIHFIGVDVPTNRVVVRATSGLLQCRPELSELRNEVTIVEAPNLPRPGRASRTTTVTS